MNKKKLMFLTIATVFAMGIGAITLCGFKQVDRIRTRATEPYSCDLPAGYTEIQDVVTKIYADASSSAIANPYVIRGTVTRIYGDMCFIQRRNASTGKIDAIRVSGVYYHTEGVAPGNVVDISGGELQLIYETPTIVLTDDNQLEVAFVTNPTGYEPLEYEGNTDYVEHGRAESTATGNSLYAYSRYVQINGVIPEGFDVDSMSIGDETYATGYFYEQTDRLKDYAINIFAYENYESINNKINLANSQNKLINITGIMYAHANYLGLLIDSADDIEITDRPSADTSVISSRSSMYFILNKNSIYQFPTYRLVGKGEIPYVEVGEFLNKRNSFYGMMAARYAERQEVEGKPNQRRYYNETYGYLIADSENDTILLHDSCGYFNINFRVVNGGHAFTSGGESHWASIDTTRSVAHVPATMEITYDFGQFGLDIVKDSYGYMYAPMTALGDILLTNFTSGAVYNGKHYISINAISDSNDTTVRNWFYYDTPWYEQDSRSTELAEYTYNALLFSMEYTYGLSEIRSELLNLDSLLETEGIKAKIKSTNNDTYETGMIEFAGKFLFEGHAGMSGTSPLLKSTEFNNNVNNLYSQALSTNARSIQLSSTSTELKGYRNTAHKEVGLDIYQDMAIIRFDAFVKDYSHDTSTVDLSQSYAILHDQGTELLFRKAFNEIETHDEVKNIIIDLSINGGGYIDVVPWIIAYLSAHPSITVRYKEYNEVYETYFNIDINYDGVIDENDTYEGKYNFYCLDSRYSFSCGNFLPTILKTRGLATLIGERSGGGVCAVGAFASASGTIFRSSSLYQLGAYDTEFRCYEDGIEPDLLLAREDYYDYSAIYDLIHNA